MAVSETLGLSDLLALAVLDIAAAHHRLAPPKGCGPSCSERSPESRRRSGWIVASRP
ncbi:MAG TPA: hypothetical protein VFE13_00100 [Caulobacteraceae bacterium]|jgi:hypothetical protein|nr:hypothetical protein [Caulobacteraceae bacterium]